MLHSPLKKVKGIIITGLVAVLVFSAPAKAATVTPVINVTGSGGSRMYLKEIYTPSWVDSGGQASPVGSYCVAVYEITVSPYLTLSQDSYITGLIRSYVTLNPTIPNGYTLDSINFDFNPNNSLTAYSGVYNYISQGYCYVQSCFDNMFAYNYSPGDITFTLSVSYQEAQSDEPPEYISCSPLASIVSSQVSAHQVPQEYGLCAEFEQALEHAQIQGFQDIVDVLNLIKAQDYSQYTYLLTALNTNNGFLQTIEEQLDDILRDLAIVQNYQSTSNVNLSTIITRLNTIIPFLQDYMPYLSNIDQTLSNTYNTLNTFLHNYYMVNNYFDFTINKGYYVNGSIGNTVSIISNNNNYGYIHFSVNDLTKYLLYKIDISQYRNQGIYCILYLKNGIIIDRKYQSNSATINGINTFLIDFPSDCNEVYINIYNNFTFTPYYKFQWDYFTTHVLLNLEQLNNNINQAETQVQDASGAAAQVASEANYIGSVVKPSIENMIGNINNQITPSTTSGMQILLAFINRPIFVTIICLVFAMAWVSYLLYGKGV